MSLFFRRYGLYFAWVLSCIACLVSLYFSDIKHHEPCHLCWYQRVCIFPLVFILGIATYHGFRKIAPFVLPQVVLGFLFASYQIAIQEIPGWNPINMCGAGPNCAEKWDIGLGFITIPMLSAAALFTIGLLIFGAWSADKKTQTIENASAT